METLFSTVALLIVIALPSFTTGRIVCQNNGTLLINGKQKTCSCPHPFTGKYCEDYACVNGISNGEQYDPESPFFNKRCVCDSGWTGPLCNVPLHNRCGDHGKEVDGKCECYDRNFMGDRCQYVTKCVNGQLYNGRCACHYGWSGDFCDRILCRQGEPNESNTACICPSKYRGKYCDFCAEPSSSPPPDCTPLNEHRIIPIDGTNALIFVLLIVVVILVVLAILFFLNYQTISRSVKLLVKERRQTKTEAAEMQSLKTTA